MRKWINLCEMKIVDGFRSNLSYVELKHILSTMDLRGVAYDNSIYVNNAYNGIHLEMRYELGLPTKTEATSSLKHFTEYGFDFYAYDSTYNHASIHKNDWTDDNIDPTFIIGDIHIITTCDKKYALKNRAFERMITPR